MTILGIYSGFTQVEPEKIRLLQSFGATRAQVLQKVILPASVPTIVSALKINVGLSWGSFLSPGQAIRLDLVMTSVLILAVEAALMYQAVVILEKYFLTGSKNWFNSIFANRFIRRGCKGPLFTWQTTEPLSYFSSL